MSPQAMNRRVTASSMAESSAIDSPPPAGAPGAAQAASSAPPAATVMPFKKARLLGCVASFYIVDMDFSPGDGVNVSDYVM